MTDKGTKKWIREHWLVLLIAAQPVLDTIAYFFKNSVATVSGYIRLAIMLALPIYLLLTLREKKRFFLSLLAVGGFCLLHVLNGFRVGYWDPVYDMMYMARVIQMPVLALCFLWLLGEEQTRRQAFRGVLIAAFLMALFILLAWITGTGNVTYGEGLGYSGWVIDDNRCANSILMVTLSTFATGYAVKTERKWLAVLIPVTVTALFLINGTKACYFSIFAIFFCFADYLLAEKLLLKKRLKLGLLLTLVLLMVFSIAIYPWTPRCRVDQELAGQDRSGEIEAALLAKGIDITDMSFEERYENPEIREVFDFYYRQYLGSMPDLYERFGMDRVLAHYRMTTDVPYLIDARVMERTYADLIWTEETDSLTKFVGFEAARVGTDGHYDMENDWPAVFYYYGYIGLALYAGFVLWFVLRIFKTLLQDFKGSLTVTNFTLALVLALQLGLAQFSGALVRRPNVSIYCALVLALIWHQTRGKEREA